MEANKKKVVVVLNEKIDQGRLMNAAAHLALGFGASRDERSRTDLHLLEFVDGSGGVHPNISALSLIVLKANSSQLRTLRERALAAGVPCSSFTSSMTEGTYADQMDRTRATPTEHLTFYGLLLFGAREELDPLTRKFSLFRGLASAETL